MCEITIVLIFITFTVECKRQLNTNKYIVYPGLRAVKNKEQFQWKNKLE